MNSNGQPNLVNGNNVEGKSTESIDSVAINSSAVWDISGSKMNERSWDEMARFNACLKNASVAQVDMSNGHEAANKAGCMDELESELKLIRKTQECQKKKMPIFENVPPLPITIHEKEEADSRSVYVGNIGYNATEKELESHFYGCGPITRVTIITDRGTGQRKGFAYVEFANKASVQMALVLDGTFFEGRRIKVCEKRTNKPGLNSTGRPTRRGFGSVCTNIVNTRGRACSTAYSKSNRHGDTMMVVEIRYEASRPMRRPRRGHRFRGPYQSVI